MDFLTKIIFAFTEKYRFFFFILVTVLYKSIWMDHETYISIWGENIEYRFIEELKKDPGNFELKGNFGSRRSNDWQVTMIFFLNKQKSIGSTYLSMDHERAHQIGGPKSLSRRRNTFRCNQIFQYRHQLFVSKVIKWSNIEQKFGINSGWVTIKSGNSPRFRLT